MLHDPILHPPCRPSQRHAHRTSTNTIIRIIRRSRQREECECSALLIIIMHNICGFPLRRRLEAPRLQVCVFCARGVCLISLSITRPRNDAHRFNTG
jgi:hypothetical protein